MSTTESSRLQAHFAALGEGLGSAYERYALNTFLERLIDERRIATVAEWPANGVLGVPGLKSLVAKARGCDVTLLHPSRDFLADVDAIWAAAGLGEPQHLVAEPDDLATPPAGAFDLVWSFCALEHTRDPVATARAMLRASRGCVLAFVQNRAAPGVHLHRLQHLVEGKRWDHGRVTDMSAGALVDTFERAGGRIVRVGGTDLPPWPDINVRLPRPASLNVTLAPADRLYGPGDPVMTAKAAARAFSAAQPERPLMRALMAWHDRLERRLPASLLRWLAHHPYVIAEPG
jgi:hypothetical protein